MSLNHEPVGDGVDHLLVRRLLEQVGARRQADLEERRGQGLLPLRGEDEIQHGRRVVQDVVTDYDASLAEEGVEPLSWEHRQDLLQALEARLFGAGSLQLLLEDTEVENIDINGCQNVFVEYADGSSRRMAPIAVSDEDLVETVQTLAAHEGLSARAFDVANPRVNLRLHDGSRLYAVQAVSGTGVLVSIRKNRYRTMTMKDQIASGSMDPDLAEFLSTIVLARKNVMLAGAVGSGKTSLLRALASVIPASERLITVERSLELGLYEDTERHPNCAALEERLPNAEGVGAVSMADLVRDSLRLNPSRVIVGEVLGDEVVTMLNAMMQGNDGSLSTIHANSSRDVVHKIATYALQAPERLPWQATASLIAAALDFIVFIRRVRTEDGQQRLVESVLEVAGVDEHGVKLNEVWGYGDDGRVQRRTQVPLLNEAELLAAADRHPDETGEQGSGGSWI